MPADEFEQKCRRAYLQAPDPLASVPARHLSAQGFAERLLRLIVSEEGRPPEDALALIRKWCEQLVWEGDADGR